MSLKTSRHRLPASLSILLTGWALILFWLLPNAQSSRETLQASGVPQQKLLGKKTDWPMLGGTPSRNMDSAPTQRFPGSFEKRLWKIPLGSRSYGGPTIANGKIFVGTNNDNPRNPRDRAKPNEEDPNGPPIDKGILMCFKEQTGEFLWQAVHDKLEAGQVNDWPREGIASTPIVEGNRVYYVSNRCTVVCADVEGFANGNDGFKGEKYQTKIDADIIWEFDMMKSLNVFPHNLAACSPLIVGDIIYVVTGNGVDENHTNLPFPEAPSFLALNKRTGKVIWKDSSPGKNVMHAQWGNPSYGIIKGVPQVIFPGGDGWLYSFKPETGELLWKFDGNPKNSKYELGGTGTRSDFVLAAPVIYREKIYIGLGQDPEHFTGISHFWCIDPAGKKGDISPELVTDAKADPPKTKVNPNSGAVWHYGGEETRPFAQRDFVFGRTLSSACLVDEVLYVGELAGYLHCLDAKTGKRYWQYDMKSSLWGSAYYVDGKIFVGNEDGEIFAFKHEAKPRVLDEVALAARAENNQSAKKIRREVRNKIIGNSLIVKYELDEATRSTPVVANGVLYVLTERHLFAFRSE